MSALSISAKGVTQQRVVETYKSHLPDHECFISPLINGWVTVFDSNCELTHPQEIVATARTICRTCSCPGIVLAVMQGEVLTYWVFSSEGDLVNKSCPTNLEGDLSRKEKFGMLGDPRAIVPLCRPGMTEDQVSRALSKETLSREDNLFELAELLGIENVGHCFFWLAMAQTMHRELEVVRWSEFVHCGEYKVKREMKRWLTEQGFLQQVEGEEQS